MPNYILGFITCFSAAIFFGINFFPVKKYDIHNGIFFQWIMCSAIWCVGLIVQLIRQSAFEPFSLIGGFIWCTGNILVFRVIQNLGLGVGLLIWGSVSTFVGWAVGFFGLFGISKQIVNNTDLNISGVVFVIFAIFLMVFIQNNTGETNISISNKEKVISLLSATIAGLCFGLTMVPSQYLIDSDIGNSNNLIDYVFSHYCGIYLTSTVYFISYCIITKPKINEKIIPVSFLSGFLWSIASVCVFIATNELQFVITIPIFSVGPGIVANIFTVFYFKEITGKKNYIMLALSIIIAVIGITLISLSLI